MSLKKYIEHHVQLHTLRVELMNGKVLLYRIDADRKEALENWMNSSTDDLMESTNEFISFYASPDRMVFIRISAIKRLIFCWDAAMLISNPWQYNDNFGVASDFEGELLIPSAIVLLHGIENALIFDADPDEDFPGIDEESFSYPNFLRNGFITLPDEDGEQNYIPVCNIDCLELKRAFIYPDDMWRDMEKQRDLDNRQN